MLSLFCVVCVLAQLIIRAVHPAAILLKKIRVVGFINSDLPWYQIDGTFAILHSHPSQPDQLFSLSGKIRTSTLDVGCWTFAFFFPFSCVPGFLIRLSVSRVCFLNNPSYFSLSQIQILLLLGSGFAGVIRPLFNQFLGWHSMKGNNCPIGFGTYDWTMPDIRRD